MARILGQLPQQATTTLPVKGGRVLGVAPQGQSVQPVKPTNTLGQKVLNAGTAVTNFLGGKSVADTFGAEIAKLRSTPEEKQYITQPSVKETAGSALQLGSLFIPGSGITKAGTMGAKAIGVSSRVAPIVGAPIAGGAVGATYDAGEKLQTGKTSGLGTATGFALPFVGPVISKARGLTTPALEKSAQTSIMKALAPTTKATKATGERVTKEILERPFNETFAFTRAGLERKAGQARELAGEAINEYGALKGQSDTSKIVKALELEKAQYSAGGVVVNKEAVDKLQKVQDIILEYGDKIDNETLRDVRRIFDAEIKKSKGFAVPPAEGSLIDAKKVASDKIRNILAEADPNIAKLNKEYTFWANLDDVISETNKRTAPQSGLGKDIVTIGGALSGVDGGAVSIATQALTFRWLTGIVKSTGWRLASARVKNALADAIAISDFSSANKLLNNIEELNNKKSPFVKEYEAMFNQKPSLLQNRQINTPKTSAPKSAIDVSNNTTRPNFNATAKPNSRGFINFNAPLRKSNNDINKFIAKNLDSAEKADNFIPGVKSKLPIAGVTIEGKTFKSIDEATKRELKEALEYINTKRSPKDPVNERLENLVSDLGVKFNINADIANTKLDGIYRSLLEQTKTTPSVTGRNLLPANKKVDDLTSSIQKAKKSGQSFDEWVKGQEKGDEMKKIANSILRDKDIEKAKQFWKPEFDRLNSEKTSIFKPEVLGQEGWLKDELTSPYGQKSFSLDALLDKDAPKQYKNTGIKVAFGGNGVGDKVSGIQSTKDLVIVDKNLSGKDLADTIMHEVEHALQQRGNPSINLKNFPYGKTHKSYINNKLEKIAEGNVSKRYGKQKYKNIDDLLDDVTKTRSQLKAEWDKMQ